MRPSGFRKREARNSSANVFTDSTSREMVAAHSAARWESALDAPRSTAARPLGGKCDGRQRILSSCAIRRALHATPRLSGRTAFRWYLQDHNVTRRIGSCAGRARNRYRKVQNLAWAFQIHLARGQSRAPRAPHQVAQLGCMFRWERSPKVTARSAGGNKPRSADSRWIRPPAMAISLGWNALGDRW